MTNYHKTIHFLKQHKDHMGPAFSYDEHSIQQIYLNQDKEKSSLPIQIISIIGGIIATITFMAFIGLSGLYKSTPAMLILGMICIMGAIILQKKYETLILDTISICSYLLGHAMIVFSLSDNQINVNLVVALVLLTAAATLRITQKFMLAFIAFCLIAISLIALVFIHQTSWLLHLYIFLSTCFLLFIFLKEAFILTAGKLTASLLPPARMAAIISVLIGLTVICQNNVVSELKIPVWISSLFLIPFVLITISHIFSTLEIASRKIHLSIYTLTLFILIPSIWAPAIIGSVLVILLTYFANYKTGYISGIIALLYFVSLYYYNLELTLLSKSILLFVSGIFLLILNIFIKKMSIRQ